MTDISAINRRTVLKSAGGLVAGSALLTGAGAGTDGAVGMLAQSDEGDDEQAADSGTGGSLSSVIEAHGHYAWFPLGPASWGRSAEPYDTEEGDSRWLANPTETGGIRVLVEDLATEPPNRNAGFDVHLGPLGELATATIDARTLQTPNTTGPATLFLALYLDVDDDGEFFEWEQSDDVDQFTGLGDDEEGVAFYGASGAVEIDGETTFDLVGAESQATLAELQDGAVDGITGETAAALYVGVVNGGEGTDEVVIDDLTVVRS